MGLKRNIKRCVKDFNKNLLSTQRSYTRLKSKLATPLVVGGFFAGGILAGLLIPKHKKQNLHTEDSPFEKTVTPTTNFHTPQFSNYLKKQLYEGLSMLLVMPGMKFIMDKIKT